MNIRKSSLLLVVIYLICLAACQSPETPVIPPLPPALPTATPFPTPAASFSGEALAERLSLPDQIQPEAGKVANNRVEALIQIHNFVDAYLTALEDNIITLDELAFLIQLAANARASLYNTGQPDMIQLADTAGWLIDLAIQGDWDAASTGIKAFRSTLPRKPSL